MKAVLTPARRRWAYRVTGAALVIAGVYGILDGQQLAAWMGLAAAVFVVADRHVDDAPAARRAADE